MDATDVNIIRHMGIARYITKALDTLRTCNIYFFFLGKNCFAKAMHCYFYMSS